MLKLLFIALALPFTHSAQADKAPAKPPIIEVQPLNSDEDMSTFKAPGYHLNEPKKEVKRSSAIPDLKVRNHAFQEAGLSKAVADWDEVDRDVLYLRARNLPLDKLKAHYPKISEVSLKNLQKQIGGHASP